MFSRVSVSKKFLAYYAIGALVLTVIYTVTRFPVSLSDLQNTEQSTAAVITKVTKEYPAVQTFNQNGVRADLQNGRVNPWFGNSSSMDSSYLGLRFTNVSLPAKAELLSAVINYSLPSQSLAGVSVAIYVEQSSNPVLFSNKDLPSGRSLSGAVNFSSKVKLLPNTVYSSPELKGIVSPLLLPGATRDLNFILKGTGSKWGRVFIYGTNNIRAPKLTIIYNVAGK